MDPRHAKAAARHVCRGSSISMVVMLAAGGGERQVWLRLAPLVMPAGPCCVLSASRARVCVHPSDERAPGRCNNHSYPIPIFPAPCADGRKKRDPWRLRSSLPCAPGPGWPSDPIFSQSPSARAYIKYTIDTLQSDMED